MTEEKREVRRLSEKIFSSLTFKLLWYVVDVKCYVKYISSILEIIIEKKLKMWLNNPYKQYMRIGTVKLKVTYDVVSMLFF